ncbi:MAG: hypothetical protein KGZ42_02725 [Melioribacter sp.]|nr:hypothetical protein [Melioribacter sp.]
MKMEIQIISLIIAFVAVIVGPIVTYRITKKNLEFQFRTITQEKWIDKLESEISNYLFAITHWVEKYPGLAERVQHDNSRINEINLEIDKMLDVIIMSIIRLDLILDRSHSVQKRIMVNVEEMKKIVNNKIFDNNSKAHLMLLYEIIVDSTKEILKEEKKKTQKIFR